MGYDTRLTGEIRIDPPLKYGEFWDKKASCGYPFKIKVHETFEHGEEGAFARRTGIAIIPAEPSTRHVRDYADELQSIVSTFPGHDFSDGFIEGHGENWDDVWRLYVRDGIATLVRVEITWPT